MQVFVRMLGSVLVRQPTVIGKRREENECFGCALLKTDRDPASVIPDKKMTSVIIAFFQEMLFFELMSPVTIFCKFYYVQKLVLS